MLLAAATVALSACSDAEGDAEPVADPVHAAMAESELAASWSGRTPTGIPVTVAAEPDPPVPGPVRFELTVPRGARPLSVDLVSPAMPVHGVVRFPVAITDGVVVADVDVPMEGHWALYVNFDDGSDAAEIRFAVAAADSAAMHHQH